MTTTTGPGAPPTPTEFRHEAYLYRGEAEFLAGIVPFVRDAVAAAEPILVVVPRPKIDMLRAALGGDAERVCFADMAELGRNPGRIISAWQDFLAEQAPDGRRVRGIGEPAYAGRSEDEFVECERHEFLLNLAFHDSPAWWLLCPYDMSALDAGVVDRSRQTHPYVLQDGEHRPSLGWVGLAEAAGQLLDHPLPPAPDDAAELTFRDGGLRAVRELVTRRAASAGLPVDRAGDLVLAANEVAANSVRHGGGRGRLRLWVAAHAAGPVLVCEVSDRGRIADPLVGRRRPTLVQDGGRGMWMVNQLCDLVQVRTSGRGTVVRLHMAVD
ncbi:sensor histidine kinase [Streptoalloteichus hindustanus]|uniref:Anti-sigma regulatory factor (Ser/Thr protein kinase) n=1 Tax=Streptoalloteichus hindustanus TaxID=2017 RepID=A0A1M4Y8F3_STRHI|nr:sensor histidine kinase [Streptoalloteichus hindustanus]SHF01978.1 Anti-sigma regulatory factor (Ser/Thr protein kinase) [Streptoalloteichus hindustanus]